MTLSGSGECIYHELIQQALFQDKMNWRLDHSSSLCLMTLSIHQSNMNPVKIFYQSTLKHVFPPISFAFAYGSAVIQQHGRPMVRLLQDFSSLQYNLIW